MQRLEFYMAFMFLVSCSEVQHLSMLALKPLCLAQIMRLIVTVLILLINFPKLT